LTGWWGLIRLATPTPYTIEDEIREGEKVLDTFGPADTWDAWQFYINKGIHEKEPATYYRVKHAMEIQDKRMQVSGMIFGASSIGLVMLLILGRRSKLKTKQS
jgi:hypothetical protein